MKDPKSSAQRCTTSSSSARSSSKLVKQQFALDAALQCTIARGYRWSCPMCFSEALPGSQLAASNRPRRSRSRHARRRCASTSTGEASLPVNLGPPFTYGVRVARTFAPTCLCHSHMRPRPAALEISPCTPRAPGQSVPPGCECSCSLASTTTIATIVWKRNLDVYLRSPPARDQELRPERLHAVPGTTLSTFITARSKTLLSSSVFVSMYPSHSCGPPCRFAATLARFPGPSLAVT